MKKPSIDIIFDTDCLSSFLWIDKEGLIYEIFPEANVYITKEVYDEIFNPKYNLYTLRRNLNLLIYQDRIKVMPSRLINSEEYLFYLHLITKGLDGGPAIGKGEASSIVEAHKRNGVLASNNLRDVKFYSDIYGIELLTTSDILKVAIIRNVLSYEEAEDIWQRMLYKKVLLPKNSLKEYLQL